MKLVQGGLLMGILLSACMADGDMWETGIKIAAFCIAMFFITMVTGHGKA